MAGRGGPGKGRHGVGFRTEKVRVKTAKGRSASSQRWLRRQLNDPYVQDAVRMGYRSRSAFKLLQLHARFGFLAPNQRVVDLGAAPGGWTQVAAALVLESGGGIGAGRVISVDTLEMEPVSGADILKSDFLTDEGLQVLNDTLGGQADVVLSDMAAPTTGHSATDHLRTVALCEAAYAFATEVLTEGGTFVAKVFKGGSERQLLECMKRRFKSVRHFKPAASRSESPEMYVVARGFRAAGKVREEG